MKKHRITQKDILEMVRQLKEGADVPEANKEPPPKEPTENEQTTTNNPVGDVMNMSPSGGNRIQSVPAHSHVENGGKSGSVHPT